MSDTKPTINTYSLRAECGPDLEELISKMRDLGPRMLAVDLLSPIGDTPQDKIDSDRQLEFRTTLELQQIQEVLGTMEDSRVMFETLKKVPLAENNLERTYRDNPFQKD